MEDNHIMTEQEIHEKQAQLDLKEKQLEEKEKQLKGLDAKVTAAKNNLYSRITVSKKTMDILVGIIAVVLLVAIIAAIIMR